MGWDGYGDRKVCPVCEAIWERDAMRCGTCRYVFSGKEPGANPPCILVQTESQALSQSDIKVRLAALPTQPPVDRVALEKDRNTFRGNMLGCTLPAWLVALSLAGLAYLVWRGVVTVLPAALTAGVALLAVATAFLFTFKYVYWYRRGPRLTTPREVLKTFYSELGVGEGKGSVGRAWVCLDPEAQAPYKDIEEFEAWWTRIG